MKIRKGTSRKEYTAQFTTVRPFTIIENDIQVLLRQALTIAGFIRYYGPDNQPDGYFVQLLTEVRRLYETQQEPPADGKMEPAQALLYTFLKQLRAISLKFNHRWHDFTEWYFDEILQVIPLPALPNQIWIAFQKNTCFPVCVPEGTAFIFQTEKKEEFRFLALKELRVNNIELKKILTYCLERNNKQLPAGYLHYVTAIRQQEVPDNNPDGKMLFGKNLPDGQTHGAGIQVAHPSLLLREGKRNITITLIASDDTWKEELERAIAVIRSNLPAWSREKIEFELYGALFNLSVSSSEGWIAINNYIIESQQENIHLRFTLTEDFPATTPATAEAHGLESPQPVLRILLNTDNWLYPYSWLKHFRISSIKIRTSVENIRNVQLYNDLGEVDTSRPFNLFGLTTEKECWFVTGNYEMSLKHLQRVSLHIHWDQLPDDAKGMQGYYQRYEKEINNHSFRIRAFYLNDYTWYPTANKEHFSLFRSERITPEGYSLPDTPLAKDIRIDNIAVNNMPPLTLAEEQYSYSIRSRAGFIRFRLETPDIGFGEKYYRILFTNRIMAHVLKKNRLPELNPPVNPLVEQITLSYVSEDIIDMNNPVIKQAGQVYQNYPLGSYPLIGTNIATPSFCYKTDTDANLLFMLTGVEAGDILTLYLVFAPATHTSTDQPQPLIVWYWGNGYYWNELPKEAIEKDTTSNLLNSGYLSVHFPNSIDRDTYDEKGNLWLRAGIANYASEISTLEHVYTHVVQLRQQLPEHTAAAYLVKNTTGRWRPEKKLPGIKVVSQISPLQEGRTEETSLSRRMRVAGYGSHRGKAVIPRDYERLILEAFPEIDCVKCIPGFDLDKPATGILTIAVIPAKQPGEEKSRKLSASSYIRKQIKEYLLGCCSPKVKAIRVVNPDYLQVKVKCEIDIHPRYPLSTCKARLNTLFNCFIASRLTGEETLCFGNSLSLNELHKQIREQEYIHTVRHLSVILLGTEKKYFQLYEYKNIQQVIYPPLPHTLFIPAKEHTIGLEVLPSFGIEEMDIDRDLIIN